MFLFRFIIVIAAFGCIFAFDNKMVPSCDQSQSVCVFNWTIDYLETMVYYSEEDNPRPVVVRDGILQKRLGCDSYIPINDTELERVVTAEGYYKVLYAINGQVPGPSIVVYEGQQVVIYLKNNLLTEGITIHWHGMVQKGTPWMDGVGTISHCPINPGETFTYRWLADPIGTHWYHAHLGVERTDGLAGALIVLPKETEETKKSMKDAQEFDQEYIMVLQDWKYSPSIEVNQEINWGLTGFLRDLNDSECYTTTVETDGGGVGLTAFESGIINGKGHYFINGSMEPDILQLPYETFTVEPYKYYRFRVVHAGMMFAFRLSFDSHDVQIISVDGNEVEEAGAESIIIHTGERADIVIYADKPVDNYWIRAETLESTNVRGESVQPGKTLGVLKYKGAPESLPNTERKQCKTDDRCRVINCPFKRYPESYLTDCVPVSDLKATEDTLKREPVPTFTDPDEFEEIFINFHFSSGTTVPFTPSVNGKNFVPPSSPPQIFPTGDFEVQCEDLDCTDHCRCTHFIHLPYQKVIQIVLLNLDDAPFSMPHPIHMHGHHFHVLKTGYAEYDNETGQIINPNQDIRCNTPSCNEPSWANEAWAGGNVPDLNLVNPPLKDTIMVPGRGYVVLRIRSDNPGYWFMHCHIEIHQIQGMAVVLVEGQHSDMAPTPMNFPTCGNFEFSEQEFQDIISKKKTFKDKHRPVVPVLEEVVEETYVMLDKPRHHEDHYRHSIETEKKQHHKEDNDSTIVLPVSVFIVLVLGNVLMAVGLFICCCMECSRKGTGHKLIEKKGHFVNNLQQQLNMAKKSESKTNLIVDSA